MKGGASRGEGHPGERDWDSFKESCEGWLCGELINSRRGESGGSVKTHGIKTIYVLDAWSRGADPRSREHAWQLVTQLC